MAQAVFRDMNLGTEEHSWALPRPFLKWAGGKGQLLGELVARVQKAGAFKRYHEPFVGGGALFFELWRSGRLTRKARLSDTNGPLIETYIGVRDSVEEVIEALLKHTARHSEAYFYKIRAELPESLADRAARIIYLNRTCYNGVYRENSRGEFNTPFGKYKNPRICDEENLRAVSRALRRTYIEQAHFSKVLKVAKAGDFVYFDPPYHPISKTASFTAYDRNGFGESAQRELADVFRKLSEMGVKALVSNSMTDFVRELYGGGDFSIDTVKANRMVNCKANGRGKVSEALIWNY